MRSRKRLGRAYAKAVIQRGGRFFSLFIVEFREQGAPVTRMLFDLKDGGWERES